MEASIDKFNKQVSRQKEDVLRWKKRYIDFNKELTALQNEINSSVSVFIGNKKMCSLTDTDHEQGQMYWESSSVYRL